MNTESAAKQIELIVKDLLPSHAPLMQQLAVLSHIRDLIEQVKTEDSQTNWISVQSELPTGSDSEGWIGRRFLVFTDAGGIHTDGYYQRKDGTGFWGTFSPGAGITAAVTHWQELPPLPQTEKAAK